MPEKEQQERNLSQRVVKEAVGVGMETPFRDPILEAVDEARGTEPPAKRKLPLAGALVGVGAALGYLAGRQAGELDQPDLESIEEPEIVEDVGEEIVDEEPEEEPEADAEGGGSRLPKLVVLLGVAAGIALLRRRLGGEEEEEWEPIEEFEPAVDQGDDDAEEGEEAEAEESSEEEEIEE